MKPVRSFYSMPCHFSPLNILLQIFCTVHPFGHAFVPRNIVESSPNAVGQYKVPFDAIPDTQSVEYVPPPNDVNATLIDVKDEHPVNIP